MSKIVDTGVHYLYRHIRNDNGTPFYIGIGTKDRQDIYSEAYTRAKIAHSHNKIWKGIVKRYGYTVEYLIETNDYDFVKSKEQEFIKLYGRIDLGTGTLANLTDGGEGSFGWTPSDETRKKLSESRTGERNVWYGKQLSEEHRKKIGDAQRGSKNHAYRKVPSRESIEKRLRNTKEWKHSEEGKAAIIKAHTGKTVSQETRNKLTEKAKNYTHIPYTGKSVFNTETKKVYSSVAKAAEDYQFSVVSLKNKLRGKTLNDTPFIYLEEYGKVIN